jgi:hypothetical protein
VLARAVGGAGRAMFKPVIQRLKEIGTPTLARGVFGSVHRRPCGNCDDLRPRWF